MKRYAISVPNAVVTEKNWQEAVKNSKLKRIEFSCSGSSYFDKSLIEQVKVLKSLEESGDVIVGSVHIPFGNEWNFSSTNEEVRRAAVRNVSGFLDVCSVLNCKNYTMHTCLEPIADDLRCDSIQASRQTFLDIAPKAEKLRISINAENLPRSCLGNTPEEMSFLMKDLPEQIGVCIDVNHLCNQKERLGELIDSLASRIRAFHFSDYDGIDECHWYPFLGVIDWADVLAHIGKLPNDVVVILETFGFQNTPAWQNRPFFYDIKFRTAEHNIFLLENAAEIQSREQALVIQ